MGKLKATEEAYYSVEEEKIIPEKDRMCLAQAFTILHMIHEIFVQNGADEPAEALEVLFHWIDETSLLLQMINED